MAAVPAPSSAPPRCGCDGLAGYRRIRQGRHRLHAGIDAAGRDRRRSLDGKRRLSAADDGIALSLGCEFLAEAVLQRPERFRTLALVSPTGMEGKRRNEAYEGARTRESRLARTVLRDTPIGPLLYRGLTTRTVMRFFLSRSWGTKDFDPLLLAYGRRDAAQKGARYAPLTFVAGALFTRGIIDRYRELPLPVWVLHGTRSSFTDFAACPERTGTMQSRHRLTRTAFEAGAMPHFE